MYEPKYKLNKNDDARFHALAVKEALGTISHAERLELEKLSRKRTRRLWRHPRMELVKRAQRNQHRKLMRLCANLDALIAKCCPQMRRKLGKNTFVSTLKKSTLKSQVDRP